ncbi:hypothetical protein JYB62_03700 [Algoriphagus lutimaris]|uniref:beta-1,6-N-acetylglucosaminyltransferase n=1 Tax=Algoriphagus lutimaris TaxID=613197 RepID=UPI00196B52AF|nr:beta-1,6-N-acetylglucosaminyltransferase [Algoriphagus lutimaris]MBN3519097.1 hypothetical protein [Algoriphagus lutimaris]
MIQEIKEESSHSLNSRKNQEPRIAYFILVHRYPEQFKRLFKTIYHPENHYLIHVDQKSVSGVIQEINKFLLGYPNAYTLTSERVSWGGYSMVQSELKAMVYLLSHSLKWDFFINLSGQDFPLKSQESIIDFLAENPGKNYLKIANQSQERPNTMKRIDHYFTETNSGFSGTEAKRAFMKNVTSYIGGRWMILTRSCCEFICNSPEIKKFEDFYQNTLNAEESFFQTVLMNTSFSEEITNDDKRAVIWIPDGGMNLRPKTLTINDLLFLQEGDNLFARKFDMQIDEAVLEVLEMNLKAEKVAIFLEKALRPNESRKKVYLESASGISSSLTNN